MFYIYYCHNHFIFRVVFLVGFFDIDKIILSCFGFSLGYYVTKKLYHFIYNKKLRKEGKK